MKSVKKTARSTFPALPLTIDAILKKTGLKTNIPEQKDRQKELILLAAEDIPAALQARLLPCGFLFQPKDDLLERLIHLEKENHHLKSLGTAERVNGRTGKGAREGVPMTGAGRAQGTAELILLAAEDISPGQRAKLLPHSLCLKPKDDILERLMQLEKENRHLRSLSVTDELTGLYNKRFFNKQMNVEIARTRRTGESFCLVFIDLDNFKIVNDTLGHVKGDEFLIKACRQINVKIRPTDFACRFGGDEFAIILPSTSLRDAIAIAKRWHKCILQVARDMKMPVTSSIGVDEFSASSKPNAQEFLHRVDQLLYTAKRTGKGKVVHPDVGLPDSAAVTWAEKEILYHIFQPSDRKKHLRQKDRGEN